MLQEIQPYEFSNEFGNSLNQTYTLDASEYFAFNFEYAILYSEIF